MDYNTELIFCKDIINYFFHDIVRVCNIEDIVIKGNMEIVEENENDYDFGDPEEDCSWACTAMGFHDESATLPDFYLIVFSISKMKTHCGVDDIYSIEFIDLLITSFIHELRHIYQFKTRMFVEDEEDSFKDVSIVYRNSMEQDATAFSKRISFENAIYFYCNVIPIIKTYNPTYIFLPDIGDMIIINMIDL